ncbi:zinc finger CCCH domain-containing protein 2-like isoform X2 [Zingiber officinale]|uniref:zinc finger CCCH domain-containing protein 2-like isoform X2 n=1 Tax=Zingiber officinale TaxID=94328 RepID=UPI001C4BB025|nr:zinc finger CCCH domain-containing protein 2-like isoform X2 [Zingiber officinale]
MMMVGGETGGLLAARIPPWSSHFEDPSVGVGYGLAAARGSGDYGGSSALAATLQKYLPCDEFAACPDFRKGGCKRGDACEYAHGVFECWLHPARYRTQPCKDGTACRRRVCFFAHTPDQLRIFPQLQQQPTSGKSAVAAVESYDGSPLRQQAMESYISKHLISTSPTTTLPLSPPSDSPPMSPNTATLRSAAWPVRTSINEIVASMRQLQLKKANTFPCSWGLRTTNGPFSSPRGRPGFCSLPATPTAVAGGVSWFDGIDVGGFAPCEELAERVESGRALRAKIFEKLSKECVMEKSPDDVSPDVGWVSDLVK